MKTIQKLAIEAGIKTYIENGRTKMEAKRAGDILRVWAAAGYDTRKNGHSWAIYDQSGSYVACVLAHPSVPGFAYSYTAP